MTDAEEVPQLIFDVLGKRTTLGVAEAVFSLGMAVQMAMVVESREAREKIETLVVVLSPCNDWTWAVPSENPICCCARMQR